MKNSWKIKIVSEEKERIAITYGDPADALVPIENSALYPVPEAIANWPAIVPLLKRNNWYDLTAFYSRRKANLSKEASKLLYEMNQKAFDAAKEKGGFVLYYQGVLLSNGNEKINPNLQLSFVPNCLSFCIWDTLTQAKAGAQIPEHRKAAQMTTMWYDGFALVKYRVKWKQTNGKEELLFERLKLSN
jgi:hypothetical protein